MYKISKCAFTLAVMLQASTVFAADMTMASTPGNQISRAQFLQNDTVKLPTDFHHWVHVGTFVVESGINIFDNSKIDAPLFANTYIEPSAYRHYMETGKWADGSQIVKEFTAAQNGSNCDKVSHVCKTSLGNAVYQESYTGFGYMIKDKKHFPKEAGNWAYFTSGNVKPPYPETAKAEPLGKCAACHITNASDQDYVFAAQKIGLNRNSPNNN